MANSIIQTTWTENSAALMHIRGRVFMDEQQVTQEEEWDGKDQSALHFLVLAAQQPVGCARVLLEQDRLHIGRVAILREYRNQRLGSELMLHTLRWCTTIYPGQGIYLHAQTTRVGFYERLGFVQQGSIFIDAGIPHIEMWHQH